LAAAVDACAGGEGEGVEIVVVIGAVQLERRERIRRAGIHVLMFCFKTSAQERRESTYNTS
jgi:hypothetical protein